MYSESYLSPEIIQSNVQNYKRKVIKYCSFKSKECMAVKKMQSHLRGENMKVYLFKDVDVAESFFQFFKEKVIDLCRPENGFMYYGDTYTSADKKVQVVCTIMLQKRTKKERSKMVLRGLVKINFEDVALYRMYQIACKIFLLYININCTIKPELFYNNYYFSVGKRNPHYKDDCLQTLEVGLAAMENLKYQRKLIKPTLKDAPGPFIINPTTGLLDYYRNGNLN